MHAGHGKRRLSDIVLCVSLVLVSAVFGIRATYSAAVYYTFAAVLLAVIGIAAWGLGGSAIRSQAEERRALAVAGLLLILPFALFSLLAGVGPPGLGQTQAESQMRYLVWATILLEAHSSPEFVGSGPVPPWASFLSGMSDTLLFFGGVLTYLATAAFAASLGRTRWLGRRTTLAFVTASLFAVLCLAMRGLRFPDPAAGFEHWYDMAAFVVGIPVVPWIMPCLFGIALLRRAGAAGSAPTQELPMAETRTRPTGASIDAYLASRASAGQLTDCKALMAMCRRVTKQPPKMWGPSIVGFGSYSYRYESGHSGESCLVGFAVRGKELVVYIAADSPAQVKLLAKLGKYRMGKVCLYFRRLADLDVQVLEALIAGSVAEVKRRYPKRHP